MSYEVKIVIIRTEEGIRYANFIAKEINLAGLRCGITTIEGVEEDLRKWHCSPEETIVHSRTAVYQALKDLEKKAYRIINKPETVKKTSDKLLTSQFARQKGIPVPVASSFSFKNAEELINKGVDSWEKVVLKPVVSWGQGEYCFLFDKDNLGEITDRLALIPKKRKFFLQEFVDYERLYRVIVIGFKALKEAVFYDEPKNSWKVSVCLNPDIYWERNPSKELLGLAEKIAKEFEAEITFIDLFQTRKGLVLNEINTACSLIIHERKSGFGISAKIAEYLISQLS